MNKRQKNGPIKKLNLLRFILCYLLTSALSIIFILSRLLKLIPEPTFPSIDIIPGMADILPKIAKDNNIPLAIKIRACILIGLLIFTIVNLISHCVKVNLFHKEITKNDTDKEKNRHLEKKRNICILGIVFCLLYCLLILGDFFVTVLKITNMMQNQHFYNSLLTGSIIYALMPLAFLVISFTREITKCFFYDKIAEDKNSFAAKIYSTLANMEYITSALCFFWDIVNWDDIKNNKSQEYFALSDRINCESLTDNDVSIKQSDKPDIVGNHEKKPTEYTFTLFYFLPIKITKYETTSNTI